MRRLLFSVLALASCAPPPSSSKALEARVHALEAQVAELRAAANARAEADKKLESTDSVRRAYDAMMGIAGQNCKDVSVPEGTQIDIPVAFELGKTTMRAGDRITITEVRGTRSDFAVGGVYLVRGEYTLASADEATLAFSASAIDPHDACTTGNGRGRLHVTRGSGKFELARTLVARGHPGLSFFVDSVDGSGGFLHGAGSGTVQFGKGDFLAR